MKLGKFTLGGTAAIITSMGLIAGLNYGEHARASVIGALLVIAIADNISDSFAIHVYKESETADQKEIFSITAGNFLVRLFVSLSFVILALILPTKLVFYVATLWGLALLTFMSYYISEFKKSSRLREIIIHLFIAILVVVASKYIGLAISKHLI
jgi:hypothetical protein